MDYLKRSRSVCAIVAMLALAVSAPSHAQGVTTASMTGIVKDAQGAVIPGVSITAVHEPSGTQYEAVTQGDGRFTIPGMRVGGPYRVTAALAGFTTEVQNNIQLQLGVAADLEFNLKIATVAETITVVGQSDPVFSSSHTGAATAVMREDLAVLPTISGRITDITRLTPQYGGSGTFAGQDNRASNMTVDGSYFNNSFGLGVTSGGIGDRTGVAPISLEAIEQVQVQVAPYDVRQGSFTGAGVNTVTRSGTNNITASVYHRTRNDSYVGKDAAGQAFNPGRFDTTVTGAWAGGPIMKNKWFAFGAFEKQEDTRPLTTFQSNAGGAPVGGNVTRVLTSDLQGLSDFLKNNFKYDTGPFDNISKVTPAKPWLLKSDYNINSANKLTVRYIQLDSSTDVPQSGSSSLGTSRQTNTTQFLTFANSNYQILENLRSPVGEWNSVFGNFTNSLLAGFTHQDESRGAKGQVPLFPFVVIGDGTGGAYTSFGNEPFTPYNLLRYNTFQMQDSVTKFASKHSITFGGTLEKFHSDNSFYFGIQSAYSYNTLADFYADANGALANPNRTAAAAPSRFQVKYLLQPGQTTPPMQPLDVIYAGGYLQDEWRPRTNLTISYGVRVDVPRFGNTAFDNPVADTLTFRDQNGSPVQYNSGKLPDTTPYWSPRIGFNYDLTNDSNTQLRGGTGVFSGKPPYVWISNQIGNTGVLYGFLDTLALTSNYGFSPNPDKYKPAPTGGTAASYELDVTDRSFRFPQTWRTNIGIDRRLPWGLVGTLDALYNRDLNAPVYINANLPAADSAYAGVDNRPRWVVIPGAVPACVTTLGAENGPCVTKINNLPGRDVTAAYVIKNQSQNRSWNISGALTRLLSHGISAKGGFNYGRSWSLVEPSSTAGSSWGSTNPIVFDPNNPALAYSTNSPGKRFFAAVNYSAQYFKFGATAVSLFYEGHTNGNTSYVFSGDANGDTVSGNDLIYIPRDTSEMNFRPLTVAGRTFTPADQSAAFEQLIQSDAYLSSHRGQYAQRNAVFLPVVNRLDLSLTQDVFHSIGGKRHSGQIRLDITNFGNLLNHDWGVGTRVTNTQILTAPLADAQGRLSYTLQTLNGQLLTNARQTSAGLATLASNGNDVYVMMLSFRYTFQ
jgi:Carboxypeptidase regulatory-like domain